MRDHSKVPISSKFQVNKLESLLSDRILDVATWGSFASNTCRLKIKFEDPVGLVFGLFKKEMASTSDLLISMNTIQRCAFGIRHFFDVLLEGFLGL